MKLIDVLSEAGRFNGPDKNLKGCIKLKKDIENAVIRWNERSQFRIGGVGNLSRSDIDIMLDICDAIINVNGMNVPNRNTPYDLIPVFTKYGITLDPNELWS